MNHLVANRFQVGRLIGRGAFGEVHVGVDRDTLEEVAIKVEPGMSKQPRLLYEAKVCKSLVGRPGFPQLRYCGFESRTKVLVMGLLGPSLEHLRVACGGSLSFKTVLMLGDQLVDRLDVFHSEGYVHRDIAPQNVLLGRGKDEGVVHLIDYGLCKRFKDPEKQKHIEYRDGKLIKGTMWFASLNALRGRELSRRDDLEAVGYVLLYLLRGSLPWQDPPPTFTKRAAFEAMARARAATSVQEMCADLEHGARELGEYLTYCKGLGFKDCPDYGYLRRIFTEAMAREGYLYDHEFDWAGRAESPERLSSPER